jgi:hypothetical protein
MHIKFKRQQIQTHKERVWNTHTHTRGCTLAARVHPRELQIVQLPATSCSCIAILLVSLMSFAAITLCVASQRVFIVVSIYFVIDSVRKLLDIPSYINCTGVQVTLAFILLRHRTSHFGQRLAVMPLSTFPGPVILSIYMIFL